MNVDYKDYYKILGIEKKASQEEVKKAFRALAVKHHPDKNPDNKAAEEQFKLVNEANGVLGNPEKRKEYDELGENWQQYEQSGGNPFEGTSGGQRYGRETNASDAFGNQADFSDFFEQFFANRAGNNPNNRGRNGHFKGGDYETEMEITLEEAYRGASRTIQLEQEQIKIATKPGSYDGQQLRVKNKGAKGSNEENRGDLFVRIKVKPHSQWNRQGNDLQQTQTIDLYTAVLGGEVIVNTLSGQVKIKVAAGTQNGKTIRLKGKGMPIYNNPTVFGDLSLLLQVQIPDKLTEQQTQLFEQIKATL